MQGRGAGVHGSGCTSAGRPPTRLFPKLPQQAKSTRADLGEAKALSTGADTGPRSCPTTWRCAAPPRIVLVTSSSSFLSPSVLHFLGARGGAGRWEGDPERWALSWLPVGPLGHPGCLAGLRSTLPLKCLRESVRRY